MAIGTSWDEGSWTDQSWEDGSWADIGSASPAVVATIELEAEYQPIIELDASVE